MVEETGSISVLQCVGPPWLHICVVNKQDCYFLVREKLICYFYIKIKERMCCCTSHFESKGGPHVVEFKIEILPLRPEAERMVSSKHKSFAEWIFTLQYLILYKSQPYPEMSECTQLGTNGFVVCFPQKSWKDTRGSGLVLDLMWTLTLLLLSLTQGMCSS